MMIMSIGRISAALTLALCVLAGSALAEEAPPNIVLIIIDDASFTDLGAYGSEIATPNIDALAARGTQFTNFHASPTCTPSRAMLMTGVDSHLTGAPTLMHLTPPEHRRLPGYVGEITRDVTTIAEHLKAAGYATYMTGKWHLGQSPDSLPSARGFDRTFILDSSGADNWEDRPYLPLYRHADWFADGKRTGLPDDFYSSGFLVDRMIDFLGETAPGQPFLSVIGFQAIHIPVQAPREFVERYNGVYDEGWHVLREARYRAAIEHGLIPPDAPLGEMHPDLRNWDDLTPSERRLSAMSMQVMAGMLEAMDHHFGRLVDHLKATGAYDNTIFVILSDNGPEYNDPTTRLGFDFWLWREGFSRDPETLGERGTYAFIGPEWASATAAPASLFKFHAAEGGTRVPLVIAGPGVEQRGLVDAFSFITDITPTLLDMVAAPRLPQGHAFTGRSLTPVLRGEAEAIYGPADAVGLEASGQSALFMGRYKLVLNRDPYGDGVWRLHDIASDPGETRDLAAEKPDLFEEMMARYRAYETDVGVLPLPPGYTTEGNVNRIGYRASFANQWPTFVSMFIVLCWILAAIGGLLWWIVSLFRTGRAPQNPHG
jgi:arylsulfatase A-like enzyme